MEMNLTKKVEFSKRSNFPNDFWLGSSEPGTQLSSSYINIKATVVQV
jgi:hypothetical protein